MIISLKALGFDQNAIGMMNTAKSLQSSFLILKKNVVIKIKFLSLYFTKKTDEDVEILNKIVTFYETLCKCQSSKNLNEIEIFSCNITTPSLNIDQINLCKKDLSKTDLYNEMQDNKSTRE